MYNPPNPRTAFKKITRSMSCDPFIFNPLDLTVDFRFYLIDPVCIQK